MTTLELEHVSKRYHRGPREFTALADVSLQLHSGELLVVLGTRKAGCSTLLRLAAGLERPDQGTVTLDGTDMRRAAVGRTVAYCHTLFSAMEGERIIEHVAAPLLARGVGPRDARRRAERALERATVGHCAAMHPDELDPAERVRVAIARAIAAAPRLLVADDPTAGVGLLQVDAILRLLQSLAQEEELGVLIGTSDAMCISGADRALSLDAGHLRGDVHRTAGEVIPLVPRTLDPQLHTG